MTGSPTRKDEAEPLDYWTAFRVVAWKAAVYSEERWHLGPKYYCPLCVLSIKDIANGCPECPLTELYKTSYKEAAADEIDRRGGLPAGVTLEALMEKQADVARLLAESRDRIGLNWDAQIAEYAQIIQEERRHLEYSAKWSHVQEMKRQRSRVRR